MSHCSLRTLCTVYSVPGAAYRESTVLENGNGMLTSHVIKSKKSKDHQFQRMYLYCCTEPRSSCFGFWEPKNQAFFHAMSKHVHSFFKNAVQHEIHVSPIAINHLILGTYNQFPIPDNSLPFYYTYVWLTFNEECTRFIPYDLNYRSCPQTVQDTEAR